MDKGKSDHAFRAALLKDAKAALKEAFELEIPGVKIKVVEDGPSVAHLVIPLPPDEDEPVGKEEKPSVIYWP